MRAGTRKMGISFANDQCKKSVERWQAAEGVRGQCIGSYWKMAQLLHKKVFDVKRS